MHEMNILILDMPNVLHRLLELGPSDVQGIPRHQV